MSDRPTDRDARPTARPLPFPSSLCHGCAAVRYVESGKGSVFLLCPLRPEKYPRQPVLRCDERQPRPSG